MSTTRVLVLGVLARHERAMHGYEIRQALEDWGAAYWADVAYGSIYFALSKMTEEGLLADAGTEASDRGGPSRRLYELTGQGRQVFLAMVRDHWWRYKAPVDHMSIAMAFMDVLPREEVVAAMRARAAGFEAALARMPELIESKRRHAGRAVAEGIVRSQVRDEAELSWLRGVIGKLERGELP